MVIQYQIMECSKPRRRTKQLSTQAPMMSQDCKARLFGGLMQQRGVQHTKQSFCLRLRRRPLLQTQVSMTHDHELPQDFLRSKESIFHGAAML